MNLKKIDRLPGKFSNNKQEKEWMKIFSQRSEMIFAIWNERNLFLKLFLLSVVINLIQGMANTYLGIRAGNNIKLIWTRVEKDTGAVVGTDVVTKSNMKVEENEIKYHIQRFVLDVRTVPMDKKYYNDKLREQSFYLTNASQEKLNNMVRNDGILTLISERRTSTAKITSVNKVTNTNNTYQIRWSEEIFGPNGENEETRNYIGVFSIDYATLKTEEEHLKNPLGIIIKDFSLSRENN